MGGLTLSEEGGGNGKRGGGGLGLVCKRDHPATSNPLRHRCYKASNLAFLPNALLVLFLSNAYVCFHVCLCTLFVPGALGGQIGCWDPLELVLH